MDAVQINGQEFNYTIDHFDEGLPEEDEYKFTVCKGPQVIGSALLRITDFYHRQIMLESFPGKITSCYTFSRMRVEPDFRGNGFGSFLLDKVVEWARREQVFIYNYPLATGPLNLSQLIAFYERHGFRPLNSYALYFTPQPQA